MPNIDKITVLIIAIPVAFLLGWGITGNLIAGAVFGSFPVFGIQMLMDKEDK